MKIQKRQGVFETNSSSVHALALPKKTEAGVKEFFGMADPEVREYCMSNTVTLDCNSDLKYIGWGDKGVGAVDKFRKRVAIWADSLFNTNISKFRFLDLYKMTCEVFDELGIRHEVARGDHEEWCWNDAHIDLSGSITTKEGIAAFLFHPLSDAFSEDRDEYFSDEDKRFLNLMAFLEENGCELTELGHGF